jgi:acetoin utilization deacetylase AcuC-like enzyme
MIVPVFSHTAMTRHSNGAAHAERPERLAAVLEALADAGLGRDQREAPMIDRAHLARVHPATFIDAIFAAEPVSGRTRLDPDTAMSPGSLEAALRAAGAVTAAAEAVARGETDRAFCAVRPPGHHAEPDTAMGFCLFSNAAVAARAAQIAGLSRVAVIDFDVHHGNGTQAAFAEDPSLFLGSIHQSPLYPGTGEDSETGLGNIVNATVAPMAPRAVWRQRFESRLMPALDAFAPDLILISAGFDAHARDPLAQQSLEAEDFAWATRAVLAVARGRCGGRVVSTLEGGYDLMALGQSAAAHVQALSEG